MTVTRILTFNFRVSYVCDTKNEEVRSITLDGDGGVVTDADLLARLTSAPRATHRLRRHGAPWGRWRRPGAVRADAEQRAKQIEQETLPPLPRDHSPARFLSEQMTELDPRIEQEAELRDHYERELRLRIDEEVHNHCSPSRWPCSTTGSSGCPTRATACACNAAPRTVVLARDLHRRPAAPGLRGVWAPAGER